MIFLFDVQLRNKYDDDDDDNAIVLLIFHSFNCGRGHRVNNGRGRIMSL